VLECGEVDIIAPVHGGGSAVEVTDAVARGRHARLSFLLATQRPAQCARILSSQSDAIYSFRMHEPRDVRWLSDAAGTQYAALARALPKYHVVEFVSETGRVTVYDKAGRPVRQPRSAKVGQLDLREGDE
jgi:hypothetical protein